MDTWLRYDADLEASAACVDSALRLTIAFRPKDADPEARRPRLHDGEAVALRHAAEVDARPPLQVTLTQHKPLDRS